MDRFILEQGQRLSHSLLWNRQREYFDRQGVKAWSTGTVPHYITSNPYTASAYGKVVFGFLRDYAATLQQSGDQKLAQPLYFIELGAGAGRFAYHFLRQFLELRDRSPFKDIPVQYVLTDLAEQNHQFWRSHPRLQPFFEQGVLDVAVFDVTTDEQIHLFKSGAVISADTVQQPLVFLANYLFDSLPQDVFYVEEGQLYERLVTLSSPQPEPDWYVPDLLDRLNVDYENHPISTDYYEEPAFNQILAGYQQRLNQTSLLFPIAGLQCLQRLSRISNGRMLLLTGDKGYCREVDLEGRGTPGMSRHGSCISLMVNYHALAQYVEQRGGQALTVSHRHRSLCICGLLLGEHPQDYSETRLAFYDAIEQRGPDDFFAVKKGVEQEYGVFDLPQLLAYLRLSGWDANIFWGCLSVLLEQATSESAQDKEDVLAAVERIWAMYYPIGEEQDIANGLALVLFQIGEYELALGYFEQSLNLHGMTGSTLYNVAMCYLHLGKWEEALTVLDRVLEVEPEFQSAQALRIKLKAEIRSRMTEMEAEE
jgi:tetratricopeptide (TPR) repeat protein